jgi:hypothetical protein
MNHSGVQTQPPNQHQTCVSMDAQISAGTPKQEEVSSKAKEPLPEAEGAH